MIDLATATLTPFDGVVRAGRFGVATGLAGVTVAVMRDHGLAHIAARKGARAALVEAVRTSFAVELPAQPRRITGSSLAFIWAGPDQWLAYKSPAPAQGMEALLGSGLADVAAIVDQSDARTLLRVSGPRARDALAKGLPLDLHPRAFAAGHAAITTVAHVGVHLWQLDDQPAYEIAIPRSSTLSFWHWLEASAAEYGLDLVLPAASAGQFNPGRPTTLFGSPDEA